MEEKKKRKAVYNPEADKRWREKNKERVKYTRYRSNARAFLKELIQEEDLSEFINLYEDLKKRFNLT